MYNLTTLGKILSKREYLYMEYFLNKNQNLQLPNYLRSTPTNSLFIEIQRSHNFIEPSNFISEISRDFYYTNVLFYNLATVKSILSSSEIISLGKFINNLFYYFVETSNYNNLRNSNTGVYKNQFRPMRKGISSMIRLQATGAIALPIETRLHILASSRDIIHS
jgi:hypothetical protein